MRVADKPLIKPERPWFSAGPTAKRPGYAPGGLPTNLLGRGIRAPEVVERFAHGLRLTREVLEVPAGYRIGIVPGSDTGAVEMAMWSLLGARPVEMLAWESFGEGWVTDAVKQLKLDATVRKADYGRIVDFTQVDFDKDVVFTWNGTTSGVRVPNGDAIPANRAGLTICDATSAAFAMDLPFDKLDVVTFSWQKVLGGEGAHGVLILSPRAVERLETFTPDRPLPKIFRLTKGGKLIEGIFKGETINTPSMLAVEGTLPVNLYVVAEGEEERVLRAANAMLEETTDVPILIGRPEVIAMRAERAGLPIRPERDFEIVNPENDPRYRDYWETYHQLMARRGVSPDIARAIMRTNTTAIAAVMVHRGEADSLICGTFGQYSWHLRYIREILARDGLAPVGALSMIILEDGPLFIADTQCHDDPTPHQVMETVMGAARHVRRFGLTPKIALCCHSQFGNLDTDSGKRMREAMAILEAREVDFTFEGEMHVDAALDPAVRERLMPHSRLEGAANVLIFGGTDAASGVRNALKLKANGLEVGPILMGMGNKAHIVTPSITTRGLLNMSVLAGTPVAHYS